MKARRVVVAHAVTFAVGLLYQLWLAFPLAPGAWRIDPTIHWDFLLGGSLVVGVVGGVVQGVVAGFGRFWPTLVPFVPVSLVALGVSAQFVSPLLFGNTPLPPDPALLIAAVTGWLLYVSVSVAVTLGVGVGVGHVVAGAQERRTEREPQTRQPHTS